MLVITTCSRMTLTFYLILILITYFIRENCPYRGEISLPCIFRHSPAEVTVREISDDSSHNNVASIEEIDALYNYAVVLSGNYAEAERLVYETFLRTLHGAELFKADRSLKIELFITLRSLWQNHTKAPCDQSDGPRAPSEDQLHVSNIEGRRVHHAIQQLPVDLREVIFLREHERLNYLELSVILNCSNGIVTSRLEKARSRLKALLLPKRMSSDRQ